MSERPLAKAADLVGGSGLVPSEHKGNGLTATELTVCGQVGVLEASGGRRIHFKWRLILFSSQCFYERMFLLVLTHTWPSAVDWSLGRQ